MEREFSNIQPSSSNHAQQIVQLLLLHSFRDFRASYCTLLFSTECPKSASIFSTVFILASKLPNERCHLSQAGGRPFGSLIPRGCPP